jgi:hypothetical protein
MAWSIANSSTPLFVRVPAGGEVYEWNDVIGCPMGCAAGAMVGSNPTGEGTVMAQGSAWDPALQFGYSR